MKVLCANKYEIKNFNKFDTILFIIYSYVKLSILNEISLSDKYCSKHLELEKYFKRYFNEHMNNIGNVKYKIKRTIQANMSSFSITFTELDALLEMVEHFYVREYNSDIHGIFSFNKNTDPYLITVDLLDSIFHYGKYPAVSRYPFWTEYHSIFKDIRLK